MKNKSLGLNAFMNGIRSILNILFPLITFPYVSRVLQVKGIGIYNFSNSIVSYFLLIAALGVNSYAIREGAKIRDNKVKISRFASEIFTINMTSTLIAYILLFLCLIIFSQLRNYLACIAIFSLQIFFSTFGVEWIYQIYEDYSYITIRSILFQIISIILLFIFVRHTNDYLNYAAITVFSAVGSNVLNFIHSRKYCHIHLIWNFNWKKRLIPIFILFFASIANMIYMNSDITLLGLMKNNYVVGIYTVSSKIYQIVKTLISAFLVVTVPRLAMLIGNRRMKEYNSILTRLTNILLTVTIPAATGVFMLAKEIILLISGAKFINSTSSLRILCFAYVFSSLAWVLTDCVLIPAKREKYVLFSMGTSAVLNIIINVILIPFGNEDAAAFSTIIAELTMCIINYYYTRDIVKDIFVSKTLFKTILSSVVGSIGIVVVCLLCNLGFQSLILKVICSVILSSIIYVVILILMKNEYIIFIIKNLKNKFSR